MILRTHVTDQSITITSDPMGTAELSNLGEHLTIEGLDNPVFYFNRIKVKKEGKGTGRELMIEVCKIADEHGITILNELNPYGKRDMASLKSFFKAFGFEKFNMEDVMVRRPMPINDGFHCYICKGTVKSGCVCIATAKELFPWEEWPV